MPDWEGDVQMMVYNYFPWEKWIYNAGLLFCYHTGEDNLPDMPWVDWFSKRWNVCKAVHEALFEIGMEKDIPVWDFE